MGAFFPAKYSEFFEFLYLVISPFVGFSKQPSAAYSTLYGLYRSFKKILDNYPVFTNTQYLETVWVESCPKAVRIGLEWSMTMYIHTYTYSLVWFSVWFYQIPALYNFLRFFKI